jgi:chaperonin GroEL (HSP60 family)
MIRISGCTNPQSCTVLLRAPTLSILDECDRSLHDLLCVLAVAMSSQKFIGGGGAVQVEIAKRLRDAAIQEKDRSQIAMEGFAEALEALPLILAQNGLFRVNFC